MPVLTALPHRLGTVPLVCDGASGKEAKVTGVSRATVPVT